MIPPIIWGILIWRMGNVGLLLFHLKPSNKHSFFTCHHFAYYLKVSAYEVKTLSKEIHQITEACWVCYMVPCLKSRSHIDWNVLKLQIIEFPREGGCINFNLDNYELEILFHTNSCIVVFPECLAHFVCVCVCVPMV